MAINFAIHKSFKKMTVFDEKENGLMKLIIRPSNIDFV